MRKLLILAAFTATAGCAGYFPPPGPPGPIFQSVANTNWRVVAVNGRATPTFGDFSMRFAATTFSSKFGCNGMGADYVQRGNIIDAGPVMGTKMACPDMSYEIQAHGVLARDMLATWNGPAALRLSSSGGTIELRR